MGLFAVEVSPDIRAELGEECLRELCADLWARDCQTCARPMDEVTPPALYLVDLDGYAGDSAHVSLHHAACRSSSWSAKADFAGDAVTFMTQCLLLPDEFFGGPAGAHGPRPTLLVNPGLETAGIDRIRTGHWHVTRYLHRILGLRAIDDGYVLGRPVAAGHVRLEPPGVVARLGDNTWSTDITPAFRRGVRAYGGVTLMLTPAFGGGLHDDLGVLTVLAAPGLELGWLALRR